MEIKAEVSLEFLIEKKVKVTNTRYINGGYTGTVLEADVTKGLIVQHPCGSDAREAINECTLLLDFPN